MCHTFHCFSIILFTFSCVLQRSCQFFLLTVNLVLTLNFLIEVFHLKKVSHFFTQDLLFTLSLLVTIVSCFFGTPSIYSIDFKVIFCLFGLMLLLQNIEQLGILTYLSEKIIIHSTTTRQLIRNITLLSFASSMFVTNDVAILTFMPIYLTTVKKLNLPNRSTGAIFLIIAANLGSSFFPFGNPQNLFLFSYFSIPLPTFFRWSIVLLLISLLFLELACLFLPKKKLVDFSVTNQSISKKKTLFLFILGLFILSSIVDFFPYWLVIPSTSLLLFFYNPSSIKKVDYRLLGTFIFFFIAIGDFSKFTPLTNRLRQQFTSSIHTFFGSILLSQLISNVPAAILIAPFTEHVKALFWGVNIGGLGTIIASLANLIGYKIFKNHEPQKTQEFMWRFACINGLLLVGFIGIFYFLL